MFFNNKWVEDDKQASLEVWCLQGETGMVHADDQLWHKHEAQVQVLQSLSML
jgi:hypothetical protein